MSSNDSVVPRRVAVLTHSRRGDTHRIAHQVIRALREHGLLVRLVKGEAPALEVSEVEGIEVVTAEDLVAGCDLVITLGGDGTILRAAELTHSSGIPILGVNLGHVGFLAELESDGVESMIDAVVSRRYAIEERLTLDVQIMRGKAVVGSTWALNEASVEKEARERMLEVVIEVDGRPLSRFGCDGVVCATPTGSTAYNFSAGGPVVWPTVDALIMVPISAHALFARPLVVAPSSVLAVEVLADTQGAGILWCDGRRRVELPPGARVEVRRGATSVRLVRLHEAPFTDRLVAKFDLPVDGWRGAARRRRAKRDTGGLEVGG